MNFDLRVSSAANPIPLLVPGTPFASFPPTNKRNMRTQEAAMPSSVAATALDPVSRDFYQSAIRYLQAENVPFLIGGAYSYARHTALERHTKDFDIFVRAEDHGRALKALT